MNDTGGTRFIYRSNKKHRFCENLLYLGQTACVAQTFPVVFIKAISEIFVSAIDIKQSEKWRILRECLGNN